MILEIQLYRFRGIREAKYQFGPKRNIIKGRNEVGKSTAKEAIAFAFYGCDSMGAKNPDHLITHGEASCEVILKTDKATLVRTKLRGTGSTIKLIRGDLPPQKLSQSELTDLLRSEFDVFGSCFNVDYFMALGPAKKAEVIGKIAKVDRKALLESLVPGVRIPARVRLENLKSDAQAVATERRVIQNQLAADQGALAQVSGQLTEFQELSSANLPELQREVQALEARAEIWRLYQQELVQYRMALSRSSEIKEYNQKLIQEKARLEAELKALQLEGSKVDQIDARYDELHAKTSEIQKAFLPVPAPLDLRSIPDENCCIRCGQLIPTKLKESAQLERDRTINEYNKKAREIADHNQRLLEQENRLIDQLDELRKRRAEEVERDSSSSVRRQVIRNRLVELVLKEAPVPQPPVKPEGEESQLLQRLSDLKAKSHACALLGTRVTSLQDKKKQLEESVRTKEESAKQLRLLEEALAKIPEIEVEQTLKLLETPGVRFSFIEGEVDITDDKLIPYYSLSAGKALKVKLLLCQTFQRLVPAAPQFYFLDNADLMDEYDQYLPKGSQIFIAKVDPATTEVEVVPLD